MSTTMGERLLAVGPLPPPADGPGVSFELFCREVERNRPAGCLATVDSSPRQLKSTDHRLSLADLIQATRTLFPFAFKLIGADRVVIFGSNGFLLRMGPPLLALTRLARKPCYLRVFGGSLDIFSAGLTPRARGVLMRTLGRADGVVVQTALLRNHLRDQIATAVDAIPGYRGMSRDAPQTGAASGRAGALRLVYVGHVNEAKGIFVLLESLRRLRLSADRNVTCDIFGPVYESDAARFEAEVARCDLVTYGGVLDAGSVVRALGRYDAFVFPTHYRGEGHPGVLIEAMIAGLPIITTAHRSIPELVQDGVNGILVTPRDPDALASAIEKLCGDPTLREEMSQRSLERSARYDARKIIPQMLRAIGAHD